MTEPQLPFVKISDHAWEDPDMQAAGPLAELAFYRAIQWSHRNNTDGFVPKRQWAAIVVDLLELGVDDDPVGTLAEHGKIIAEHGGHRIRAWGKWQTTSVARQRSISEARRKGGQARAAGAPRVQGRFAGAGSSAGNNADDRTHRSHQQPSSTSPASAASTAPAQPAIEERGKRSEPADLGVTDHSGLDQDSLDLAPAPAKLARRRDLSWEAFCEVTNVEPEKLSGERRKVLNGMLRNLRLTVERDDDGDEEHAATAAEIHRRAQNWPWPDIALTPEALTKRWAELGRARDLRRRSTFDEASAIAERLRQEGR